MKKRIIMLAVIAVLVLSSVGMAAATDHVFFKLQKISNVSKDTSGNVTTISFDVTAGWEVASDDDTPAQNSTIKDFDAEGWFKNANLSKWVLGGSSNTFTPTSFSVSTTATNGTSASGTDVNDPYYLMKPFNSGTNNAAGNKGTFTFTVTAKGTLQYPNEDCQIKVSLYNSTDNTKILDSYTSGTTQVVEVDGAEVLDNIDPIDYDPRNPDSVKWDGLDPTFSNTINKTSYDIGKNKPKLVSPAKTALTFTSGASRDLTITMKGPIETLDVYIAQKDAKKLWPASADSISGNIQLTKANIKKYNIPFRVTSHDLAKTTSPKGDTSTDDKLKKAMAKGWKDEESTVTISFNGGKLQYKGFPVTISMANGNTSNKPVAKAVKLNIGDTFTTPSWTYMVSSKDTTTSLDVAKAKVAAGSWDEYSEHYKSVRVAKAKVSGDVKAASWDLTIPAKVSFDVAFKSSDQNYYIIPEKIYKLSTDNKTKIVSEDNSTNKYIYTTTWDSVVDYYYTAFEVETVIGSKTKPEAVAAVYPDTKTANDIYTTFYASGDAPYAITLKPGLSDTDKLNKFFKTQEIQVVQPVYDYLGNVKTQGYVVIAGVPTNTEKESKLALTLTATNPSTKKKAAAKVTAMGKLAPTFDKTTTIGGEKWITTTKRVQAGKAPSVKPKAKGSKTISYLLGDYDLDEDTLSDVNEGDDDLSHEALAAKLAAVGLSFDAKKGIIAIEKNKTNPTLNEAGDAFESLDIVITAANNVGTDHAYAAVAITGAKPALSGKEVEFALTDKDYGYKTFALKAGKDEVSATTTTANVKATESSTTSAISQYGLAVVTYDELLASVKSTDFVAAGSAMPTGWTPNSTDYGLASGTVKAVKSGDIVTGYKASTDVTYYNGKVFPVLSPDEKLKNTGIVQVVNPTLFTTKGDSKTAKGVKVALALENFGAIGKGSLKVKIPAAATSTNGALPASMKALANNGSTSSAAKTKTNGTAGLTYNGSAPDADADADSESAEGSVTIGTPRTVADLTAGQQAFLAEKGYTVVAVLPEITADAEGQYDFDVELDEEAPEGATLIWLAFPKNAAASEDDEIVDFYDEAGTPVEGVPASHKIIASPWLREAVTYEPVIAIEAE